MPIRFAYHPGNVAHSSAPEVDETMRAACRSLDIELIDMPGATSCGAGILGQANRRLQITLNARTMSIAEDLGMDIITPCATTAATLFEDLMMLKADSSLMGEVNRTLEKTTGRVLEGSIKIRHLLQVILEGYRYRELFKEGKESNSIPPRALLRSEPPASRSDRRRRCLRPLVHGERH